MDLYNVGIIVKQIINSIPNSGLPSGFKAKVFPLVAPVGTTFPFCVYRRTSGRFEYNDKDYDKDENVTVQVKIISSTYDSSISLISKISDAFVNFKNINISSQNEELDMVDNIAMIDSNEEFYEESFIQTIIINISFK